MANPQNILELDERLGESIAIAPTDRICGTVRPPGSKSITNRALVISALADGPSQISGALASQDTQVMIDALRAIGIDVQQDRDSVRIEGKAGGVPTKEADLYCANSGTTIRFLTAMLAAAEGNFRLDGSERMRQRPIADLVDALRKLGCEIDYEGQPGCPPLRLRARRLSGNRIQLPGSVSSQFLSGLLMAAPYAVGQVEIELVGELVSEPFVAMTMAVMQQFGGAVQRLGKRFIVRSDPYRGQDYQVEPDATAASYFWAAAALTRGAVTVAGIGRESLQGDVRFVDALEQMGARVQYGSDGITVAGNSLHGIDIDMGDISDTFMTLAVVAGFADSPTRIRGVAHSRKQETDRVTAMATELKRAGCKVEEHTDGLTIYPSRWQGAMIETYDDHRIAMSFALAGLRVPGIIILDPGCVKKTFPEYFHELAHLMKSCQ